MEECPGCGPLELHTADCYTSTALCCGVGGCETFTVKGGQLLHESICVMCPEEAEQ